MFQVFSPSNHKPMLKERMQHLRQLLSDNKIDGYFVPHSDEFNNEYLPECHKRFEFITGFTGSWGMALILKDTAHLFVDSRYILQAPNETDCDLYDCICVSDTPLKTYLLEGKFKNLTIGYDAALHTKAEIDRLSEYLPHSSLKVMTHNLIDALPKTHNHAFPNTDIIIHPQEYAGKQSLDKINAICQTLVNDAIDSAVIALPESLCWLLNVRANDVPHTPYVLSYGIIYKNGTVDWFVGKDRITSALRTHLPKGVTVYNRDDFYPALGQLSGIVQNDNNSNAAKIYQALKANNNITNIMNKADPCLLPKAIKNDTEIQATINAHIRDGAAVIRFSNWLQENYQNNITEIDCVKQLEQFRRDTQCLQDVSFDTIAGTGANGAIVHYRVNVHSNQTLKNGDLFLLDSGGQYYDGTTDITRTFAIGTPTPEMVMRYTQVLKGHLAIAMAKFPEKTTGAALDPLARMPLWQAGIDYGHGTGHGVGLYLSVHEGPQSISARSTVALQSGMILSNEPGYYKTGSFGIRIENLELVTPPMNIEQGEKPMMGFQTLTMVPYAQSLIDIALLTQAEIAHINAYHCKILHIMQDLISDAEYDYLKKQCALI
ncbi:MAG: Xaa-Pro aminopeptidase [Alphaproteobacteria bacterium]|jgi:Xaa-Pro aminopeptidase